MLIDFGVPLSIIFTFLTFGFHVRLVAFNAWLLLFPKTVALLHISHFAIYYTSFYRWRILKRFLQQQALIILTHKSYILQGLFCIYFFFVSFSLSAFYSCVILGIISME
jgi:hypothetical protein